MSYFSDNYPNLTYPKRREQESGFHNAQIGAVHAVGAHFTIYEDEPALVTMPTGSGKTAVLSAVPFLLSATRVLVISSSVPVRGQITDEFVNLSTLKEITALPADI